MNPTIFQQHYNEQLELLPAINQEAIRSCDWMNILVDIGKKNALMLDEVEDLQIETMLVLVGITPADNYEAELIEKLALSPAQADKLLSDINQQVFTPIHDYIVRGGPEQAPTGLSRVGIDINTSTPVPVPQPPKAPISPRVPSGMRIDPHADITDIKIIPHNVPEIPTDVMEHKLGEIFNEETEVVHQL